ncbi:hypothetical protein B0H11DRAFT_2190349 [Mycena galericulata]|nr:hypothetical protein B0H11DRAFT_2190349 [Mycena galericulata]
MCTAILQLNPTIRVHSPRLLQAVLIFLLLAVLVQRIERVTGLPSQFPIPEIAFVIDLTKMEHLDATMTVDAILKDHDIERLISYMDTLPITTRTLVAVVRSSSFTTERRGPTSQSMPYQGPSEKVPGPPQTYKPVRKYKSEEISLDLLVARAHEVFAANPFNFQLEAASAILKSDDVGTVFSRLSL